MKKSVILIIAALYVASVYLVGKLGINPQSLTHTEYVTRVYYLPETDEGTENTAKGFTEYKGLSFDTRMYKPERAEKLGYSIELRKTVQDSDRLEDGSFVPGVFVVELLVEPDQPSSRYINIRADAGKCYKRGTPQEEIGKRNIEWARATDTFGRGEDTVFEITFYKPDKCVFTFEADTSIAGEDAKKASVSILINYFDPENLGI